MKMRKHVIIAALGGESGNEGMPTTMWVDDQFRVIKQEVAVGEIVTTTEYSDFDQPVDIPDVS
ncbi:hypothetical protein [Tessaracoccus massiliensis]|uniref:hypothetical protein n=1 Tax=Tessaracoccus massiliensis TaxID=1522311 RepID=UPI00058EB65B|nr:hypothetical protein [Tessaracoccus massiliensis]